MRYEEPELLQGLAAEYVIGTLRGRARRRFERVLAHSEAARFQVAFWEQRLSEFGQVLRPVSPPESARDALLSRIAAPPRPAPRIAFRRARWRRRAGRIGLYAAGFATAASLALAFLLGQQHADTAPRAFLSAPPIAQVAAPAVAADEALPMYTAQMHMPGSRMGWLLSVSPDREELIVVAADDFLQIGRHRLQLWCYPPGADPIPLGALPYERDATVTFRIPDAVRGLPQLGFAVSLEPEQGPRAGRPSTMVLDQTSSLDAI